MLIKSINPYRTHAENPMMILRLVLELSSSVVLALTFEMSSPGPPSSESAAGSVSSDAIAAAAELRTRQATPQLTAAKMAAEHEKRQKFRRLVDPGITRPNSKDQALKSLKVGVVLVFYYFPELQNCF